MSILLVLGACDDREFIELVSDANTTVSISASSVVLTEDIATTEVLTVSWSDPNYGFDAAPSYKLLIDLAGVDFTAPQIIAVGADLNKVFTAQELNGKMLSLGLKPNEETNIDLMVQTTLSDAQIMFFSNCIIKCYCLFFFIRFIVCLGIGWKCYTRKLG